MGPNPDPQTPDIPLGLGMALFQQSQARNFFEALTPADKTKVISYVQSDNKTGDDALYKIDNAIEKMNGNSLDFLA